MTLFGKILAILNILAAAALAYLVLLDYGKREAATAAVREFDIAAKGLPDQQQYNDPSQPRMRYVEDQPDNADSEALKARFQAAGAPGKPVSAQADEVARVEILVVPAINDAADSFVKDAKDKLKALKDVLDPLAVNGDQLADYRKRIEAAKKNDAEMSRLLLDAAKRNMLAQILLPVEEFWQRGRRDLLAAAIGDLSKPIGPLEKLVERRFEDVLRPFPSEDAALDAKAPTTIQVFELVTVKAAAQRVRYTRSAKDQKVTVALIDDSGKEMNAGDKVSIRLTNMDDRQNIEMAKEGTVYSAKNDAFGMSKVLAGVISLTVTGKQVECSFVEREPMDRKLAIAYLLTTVSEVTRPDGKRLLEDSLPEKRVEVVVGRERFNRALEMQAALFREIADRLTPTIAADRQTFIDQYRRELYLRLPYLAAAIKREQANKKYWDDQLEKHEAQKRERRLFRDQILAKIQEERRKATEALANLARFQEQFFEAQKAGSGVAEENQRLEKQIRIMEMGR